MEKIISSIISRFFYKCFFSWSVFLSRLSGRGSTTLTNRQIMTPFVPRIGVLMQSSRESGLGATGRKIWMKIHLRGANEVSGSLITAARGCCKQPTGFFSQIFLVVEPKTDSRVSAVLSCNFCKNPLYLEKKLRRVYDPDHYANNRKISRHRLCP